MTFWGHPGDAVPTGGTHNNNNKRGPGGSGSTGCVAVGHGGTAGSGGGDSRWDTSPSLFIATGGNWSYWEEFSSSHVLVPPLSRRQEDAQGWVLGWGDPPPQ